jgi:hypothetical protein
MKTNLEKTNSGCRVLHAPVRCGNRVWPVLGAGMLLCLAVTDEQPALGAGGRGGGRGGYGGGSDYRRAEAPGVGAPGAGARPGAGVGAPGVGVSRGVGAGAPGVGVTPGVGVGARGAGVAPGAGVGAPGAGVLPKGYVRVVPTGYTTVYYGGYWCAYVDGVYYRPVYYEGTIVYVMVT